MEGNENIYHSAAILKFTVFYFVVTFNFKDSLTKLSLVIVFNCNTLIENKVQNLDYEQILFKFTLIVCEDNYFSIIL